jgi:hypothetical protein
MPEPVPGRVGRWAEQIGGEILTANVYRNEKERWCGLLLGSVLFRLVTPPLQLVVVGPYPIQGIWFSSRLLLEGTSRIQNLGTKPVAHGTRGTRPRHDFKRKLPPKLTSL